MEQRRGSQSVGRPLEVSNANDHEQEITLSDRRDAIDGSGVPPAVILDNGLVSGIGWR
jgi:hypothetical protein